MTEVPHAQEKEAGGGSFDRTYAPASEKGLRFRLYRLLFHHEARDERNFDLALIVVIFASIIVVPTGIYTAELARTMRPKRRVVRCGECGLIDHESDAWHCRRCGRSLPDPTE